MGNMLIEVDDLQYKCNLWPKFKCFQDSYFVRTVKKWNDVSYDIRILIILN